jgi:hypothetical protein
MLMLIVLPGRMFRFIVYRQIEVCEIDKQRFEFSVLYGKLMKPRRDRRADPPWPRAANDGMKFECHDFSGYACL